LAPRAGSLVSHRTLTAAIIDSRDFIASKRHADIEVMLSATRQRNWASPVWKFGEGGGA